MSTKLIGALMILFVVWGGYKVFVYYNEVQEHRSIEEEQASGKGINPAELPGLPDKLRSSLSQAQRHGAEGIERWLSLYGNQVQDPRRAWIQLDYCTLIAGDDPQKAKAVYVNVKERLQEDSPVYPRLKQLEKSFE